MKDFNFPIIDYLRELETVINMDSGTANICGCRRVADFYRNRMERAGLSCQTIYCGPNNDRPIVVGTTPAADVASEVGTAGDAGAADFDFLLVGHMDTVFPTGTAAKWPFRLETADGIVVPTDQLEEAIANNRIPSYAYGPGTVDMKSAVLLMIYIAEYLIQHHPHLRLCLLLDSDEETGSEDSLDELIRWGNCAKTAFVFEGGRKKDQFVSARKGCNKYEFIIHGIASHAGTAPQSGASAIVEMGHLITALDGLKNYAKGTSVNIGLVEGGTALNVVPDLCKAQVEVRFTDIKEMARIQKSIDKLSKRTSKVAGTSMEVRLLSSIMPLREIDSTRKLMERMTDYGAKYVSRLHQFSDGVFLSPDAETYPVNFVPAGGLSDANRLAECKIPIIDGCGPGGGFPHSEKEFLLIETVLKRFAFFTGLLPWLVE